MQSTESFASKILAFDSGLLLRAVTFTTEGLATSAHIYDFAFTVDWTGHSSGWFVY